MDTLLIRRYAIVACTLVFCFNIIPGQAPPTLSAGLTAVTGQKGDIDVALLSEIISEKQEEVKRELLQRHILNKMEDQSFALQNFVYSCFHALLSFKDVNAIEKELLTQVSILSLQVGFAETFLKLSYQSTPSAHLENAVKAHIDSTYLLKAGVDSDSVHAMLARDLKEYQFLLVFKFDGILHQLIQENGLGKKKKKAISSFQSELLDIVFEAVRRNETLDEKGFVKIHPNLVNSYGDLSRYSGVGVPTGQSPGVYQLVDALLGSLVTYHPLLRDFIEDENITLQKLLNAIGESPDDEVKTELTEQIIAARTNLIELEKGMGELTENRSITKSEVDEVGNQLQKVLDGLWQFELRNRNEPEILPQDYYFITDVAEPLVTEMISLGIFGQKEFEQIRSIRTTVFKVVLHSLTDRLDDPNTKGLLEMDVRSYGYLIKIITSLSRLDQVRSYEHIFNTLAQIGINNLERTDIKFLKDIIYYLEAYSSIDRENNLINVEVEALLLKILTLYENRVSGDVQAYFGIGLGQTVDINYRSDMFALPARDSGTLSNLSFASERIGFKIKVVNNKRIQSMTKSELSKWSGFFHNKNLHRSQQPIISDVYFMGYGSGLLYNVADLTSVGGNFDNVLVGFGLGVAFFNALDFNIWRASPMVPGESFDKSLDRRGFWGFSFDIKLTEYLSAVGEKRARAKAVGN